MDTNFILALVKQHRNPEEEIRATVPGKTRIIILDLVALELERLARSGPSTSRTWARASLALLSKRGYPVAASNLGPSDVDASLIAFALAEKTPTAIATIDRELKTALAALGIPTISPRTRYGLMADALRF